MQLPFRSNNPQAGLAKAEAALLATGQKIAALQADRQETLRASDDVGAVMLIDSKLATEQGALVVHKDRCAVLRQAVREQEHARLEQARQAAIADLEKVGAKEVERFKRIEQLVKDLGNEWNEAINWGSRMKAAELQDSAGCGVNWQRAFTAPAGPAGTVNAAYQILRRQSQLKASAR